MINNAKVAITGIEETNGVIRTVDKVRIPKKRRLLIIQMLDSKGTNSMEEVQKCINALDFVKDWDSWRGYLQDAIKRGRDFGMSDDMIQNLSVKVGDFLAEKVCPATPEEQLMKDLWNIANQEERKALARLIFKLADRS